MIVSELAKKYAPWSISKAAVGETCALQFQHKYLLKTPEGVKASGNQVGTCAHSVLEERLGGAPRKVATERALEKTPLTSDELEMLSSFEETIEEFLRRFDAFCKNNGVTEIIREEKWALTAEGKKTTFFAPDAYFRGAVDLAAVTRDRDVFVIDHKSGVAKDITKDNKFKNQLNSYAVMAVACLPDVAGVRSGIHFLQGDATKRLQWLDYIEASRVVKVYTPWLFKHLNNVAEMLQPPFVGRPKIDKWPCSFCSYRPDCTAYSELIRVTKG
jgi:CRISPR/Cas system-associated exonuclease Cas4 (RecB family)